MKIGIDLDNTIINYKNAFRIGARKLNYLIEDEITTKNLIKSKLIQQENGQYKWERLQGMVYGEWIAEAKLYPGFLRFLKRALIRGSKIYIVSHKTEYGHNSNNKISLRKSAVNFLTSHGVNTSNNSKLEIYFLNSKEEKINKINELNLKVFIDDLPEILLNKNLEKKVEKILFDPEVFQRLEEIRCANNWDDISQYLFDEFSETEIIEFAQKNYNSRISYVKKINSGKNAKTFLVSEENNQKTVLKFYPADDSHNRLKSESESLKFLKNNGFENIPEFITSSERYELGIYSLLVGDKSQDNDLLMLEMIKFVSNLEHLSHGINLKRFTRASAACYNIEDTKIQILDRFRKINFCSTSEIEKFLWVIQKSINFELERLESRINANKSYQFKHKLFLSPSDFGKHNVLTTENGKVSFLDFEYFGLDDPAKFICDVALHPGSNWGGRRKKKWFDAMSGIFSKEVLERTSLLLPLYTLNWVLIMLNGYVKNRIFYPAGTKISSRQLGKATQFFRNNYLLPKPQ